MSTGRDARKRAMLRSLCDNCKIGTSGDEQFAEKRREGFVAAVFKLPSVIAAAAMAH